MGTKHNEMNPENQHEKSESSSKSIQPITIAHFSSVDFFKEGKGQTTYMPVDDQFEWFRVEAFQFWVFQRS